MKYLYSLYRLKDWLPLLASVVAVLGIGAALYTAYKQRELQLKLAIFDRRYVIFQEVEKLIHIILKTNGSYKLLTDRAEFQNCIERAEFIFPDKSKVHPYLTQLYKKADRVWELAWERDAGKLPASHPELMGLLSYFGGPALTERTKAFKADLHIKS